MDCSQTAMAGEEGSELHDMEETMSELGFVGSDDDDNKEIWETDLKGDAMAFSSGAGGRPGSSGRRGILVAPALQDVPGEQISTPEESVPIEVAQTPFSLDIQSEATEDIENLDTGMQVACQILKEPSYKGFYGSNKSAQQFGLGDSPDKLASSSSPQRVCSDNFSDALSSIKLCTNSAKEGIGFNQVKFQEQISGHENIESRLELNRDAIGGLASKGSPVVKLGKQLEQRLVKALSAQPYHPVFPMSRGVGSHSSPSQQANAVTSSGVAKYIGNSDTEMQVACQIAKEPSYGALHGSSNPYQPTGLGNFHDKFAPSSFQGVNTDSISNTLSGMNLHTGSAEGNTEYNWQKLQGQIDGYKNTECGSGLNKDDSRGLAVTGGSFARSGVQVEERMVKALSAQPYYPVFPVSRSASSSLSPQHPNVVNLKLECPDYHSNVYCICSSQQPTIEAGATSIIPHVEEPHYQERFSLADSTRGVWGMAGGSNPDMPLLHHTAVTTKDYADVAEIHSTLDHQSAANNIQMQFAPQVVKPPAHQSLHGSNYPNILNGPGDFQKELLFSSSSFHGANPDGISGELPRINLQGETVVGKADFNQLNIHRQAGRHENTAFHSLGTNSEFRSTPTLLRRQSSEFSQMNSAAMRGLAGSGSSSIRPGPQGEQSTMMNHARSFHPVSGVVVASLPRSPLSSMSEGSSSSGYPNMINHGMGFIPIYQPSPLAVEKMGHDEARNLDTLIAQLLQKHHGKAVAPEAQASCVNDEPSVRRGSAEDFVKIIRLHEEVFRVYFHPEHIPPHVMDMLDQCFVVALEMESHSAPGPSTPRLAHLNEPSGFKGSGVDFTQIHDSTKPNSEEFNAALFLGGFDSLSKASHRIFHIKGHVFRCSLDQCGSRFIQQKLPTATHEERAIVFEEIMPHVAELVIDVFGNYVVQKLMEHGTPFHKRKIIECLIGSALRLSFHQYGCRVIQRAVEIGELDQKIQVARQLQGSITALIHDQNANHVIQKCIEHVPHQHIQFILESMYGHVTELSVHPYGCRVIQRILEHCHNPSTLEIFLAEIMDEVYRLAKDQYGNYVVQHILEHGSPRLRSAVIRRFAGRIITMSQQKFASNVIEKCLVHGSYEERQMIINEVLSTDGEANALKVLVNDQYANYVVQKVMETCDEWQRKLMLEHLKAHHGELSHYPYARHVLTRLERLIQAGESRMALPRHSRRPGKEHVVNG